MNKEESKTVQIGDELALFDISITPGRSIAPEFGGYHKVKNIHIESSVYVHFDVGYVLTEQDIPLKSRDTGEEIDGSNTYWLHPSRFNKINN